MNHFDKNGHAIMVDVGDKDHTERKAVARGKIRVSEAVLEAVMNKTAKKGDVLGVARVAGIMAIKNTSSMIPMCHPLMITGCKIDFDIDEKEKCIIAQSEVKLCGNTGVEMEALTGVSVALLTIYDMCKALDKGMVIEDVKLMEKLGGKSGHYERKDADI